ncbi:NfeD family protein [Ideonella sp. A 288]|uniref:NfeD family protein n=1 Tax=Ideonella sp. A 288 TaxID=1962181 RepID=UPI001F2FA8C4|nr:NfeD family protein [Ideonella sp. A 288]
MDWSASTWWWLVCGAMVAAELATGTFYLLMLALGAAASALAAHAGMAVTGQLVVGALVGGGSVAAWHVRRGRQPPAAEASANRDIHLDVGSPVHVAHWEPDGSARVSYRGAGWDARFAGTGDPVPGEHVVRAVDGNRLLLDRAPH